MILLNFLKTMDVLKLLLIALPWLAALPGHAAPRVPADDGKVLERLPLRPRDPAAAQLRDALGRAPQSSPTARLWTLTRLAEMAARLGDTAAAERHFKSALALGLHDNFLLAAYADLGLPRDALLVSLVGFNFGVEAGQLAVVCLFLPAAFLGRRHWIYRRLVVAAAWMMERVFNLKIL